VDGPLAHYVFYEELDRLTAHPMVRLKFTDEAKVIPTFDPREQLGCERTYAISADLELELAVHAPLADRCCFDDVRVNQERRHRVPFSEWSQSL